MKNTRARRGGGSGDRAGERSSIPLFGGRHRVHIIQSVEDSSKRMCLPVSGRRLLEDCPDLFDVMDISEPKVEG